MAIISALLTAAMGWLSDRIGITAAMLVPAAAFAVALARLRAPGGGPRS